MESCLFRFINPLKILEGKGHEHSRLIWWLTFNPPFSLEMVNEAICTSLQAFEEYCILSKPVNYFERFLVVHAHSWYAEVVRKWTSLHPMNSLVDLKK